MTTPLLPFSNLTTWGSPWHGIVKEGELTLANAAVMSYPQPGTGDGYLVKFAGVPDVERTIEQQAADALAGYDWRNYAIIAGDSSQLHGRNIGSPWLYKDGDGKVWRLTVTFVAGTTIKIEFTEFGRVRLGDEPGDEYEQLLSVTGTEIATLQSITLMDTHPEGGEAVFVFEGGQQSAFVKLSIDAGVCSATVLKTDSEMVIDHSIAEATTTVPDVLTYSPSYYRVRYVDSGIPDDPGLLEFSSSVLSDIYDEAGETKGRGGSFGAFSWIEGSETKEKTDSFQSFLWACYAVDGSLHYYSALYKNHYYLSIVDDGDWSGSYSASATDDDPISMSGSITVNSGTTTTQEQTYTFQLLRDAEVMDEYVIEMTDETYSGTERVFSGATNDVIIGEDSFQILPGGGGSSATPVETDEKTATFNNDDLAAELDLTYGAAYYQSDEPNQYLAASEDLPGFELIQSTNKLIHAVVEYNYQSGYRIGVHIAPDAQDAITSEVSDLTALFASFQPVTKQIVREQDSVASFV